MAGKMKTTPENAMLWTGDPSVEGGVYAMRESLLTRLAGGAQDFTLDMKGRTQLHTSGLHLLLAAANTLRSLEKDLVLLNTGPELKSFLERLNVDRQFRFAEESGSDGGDRGDSGKKDGSGKSRSGKGTRKKSGGEK